MKISELTTSKTVQRRLNEVGKRHLLEEKTFDIPYNPNVEIVFPRLFAKLIDVAIVIACIIGIYQLNLFTNMNAMLLLGLFGILLIGFSTLMETLLGTTFGKWLVGLLVVDDDCTKISFRMALYKNSLAFIVFVVGLLIHGLADAIISYDEWQQRKQFYVIKRKEKSKVLALLRNKNK